MNTEPRTRRSRARPVEDPLGDDDVLARLADAALPAQPARPLTAVPAPPPETAPAPQAPPAPAAPQQHAVHAPAEQAPAVPPAPQQPAVQAPAGEEEDGLAGGVEDFIRQKTVQVDAQVKARFRDYQSSQAARLGERPANHAVVFAALNAADGRYAEVVEARRPRAPEGQRFGRLVPGRQAGGSPLKSQLNFRPTVGEARLIDMLARQAGAESVSAFLNAVLDDFLPPSARKRAPRA